MSKITLNKVNFFTYYFEKRQLQMKPFIFSLYQLQFLISLLLFALCISQLQQNEINLSRNIESNPNE